MQRLWRGAGKTVSRTKLNAALAILNTSAAADVHPIATMQVKLIRARALLRRWTPIVLRIRHCLRMPYGNWHLKEYTLKVRKDILYLLSLMLWMQSFLHI